MPAARICRFFARTSGGSNQRCSPMPVPPFRGDADQVLVVVIVGLFAIGVERRELGRTAASVQTTPPAPARRRQQALALAGLPAPFLLFLAQPHADGDLDHLAVLGLAIPGVRRRALDGPPD